MALPFGIQQSTLAGGLAGFAAWGIGLGLAALGVTVPANVITGVVAILVPVVVHYVPDAAKVDEDIKEVAAIIPKTYPDYNIQKNGATDTQPVAQGQPNSNINQG